MSSHPSVTLLHWVHPAVSLLKVTGADARSYLQRRTCNQVASLSVGQHQLNAVLERKAELQALFDLYCLAEDSFLLVCQTATTEALLHQLKRFALADDVSFEALPPMALLASRGALPTVPQASQALPYGLPHVLASPFMAWGWLSQNEEPPCQLTLYTMADVAPVTAALQGEAYHWLSDSAYQQWQQLAGLPSLARGEWKQTTLLPALGLNTLAISTTKGCYLGQETVAKLDTYGNVPQLLMAVLWEQAPLTQADIALPLALISQADGSTAGELVSLGQLPQEGEGQKPTLWLGMAYLKRAYRSPQTPLHIKAPTGQLSPVCQQVATFPLAPEVVSGESVAQLKALALHRQAMAFYLGDDYPTALTLLDDALATHPSCWAAVESKGVVLGRMGRYPQAIELMKHWLAHQPEAVMAYSNLSLFYAQLGDKETAETYKAEATKLTMRLAMQAAMAKKQAATGQEKEQAQQQTSQPTEALSPEQRAALLQRAELLQHALSVAPSDPLALYGLGSTYFTLGQFEQAVTYLQQTVGVSPKHSKAYAQLATALLATHQPQPALKVAQQGLAVATSQGDLQVVTQLNQLLAGQALVSLI